MWWQRWVEVPLSCFPRERDFVGHVHDLFSLRLQHKAKNCGLLSGTHAVLFEFLR